MIVFFNLFGARILGLVVGYERSYHGRAAGMRTYGLVCMAAAALTVIAGYPSYWFGEQVNTYLAGDPTRVIQGIVTGCMMWISKLESWLPSRPAIPVTLEFQKNFVPQEHTLRSVVYSHGYEVASGSFTIRSSNGKLEWHFVAIALSKNSGATMNKLANSLSTLEGVEDFALSHARN